MKLSLTPYWDATTTIQAARTWERPGIDGIWLAETMWYDAAIPLATACASVTERLRIGVGVGLVFAAHPTYMAMHYATLVELSKGRAVLGLGSGVESSFHKIGVDTRLPRTAVKESIEIIRGMIAGETVKYDGKRFTADEVSLGFAVDSAAPLFWGAMGNRSIDTCGEVADGWIISVMEPARYVERGVRRLRDSASAAGRDPDAIEVAQFHLFACDPDSETARKQAKELIATIARDEFEYFVGMDQFVDAFVADLDGISRDEYVEIMRRLADGEDPVDVVPDTLVDQVSIAGDPDECAAAIRKLESFGVTEVILKPASADLEAVGAIVGDELAPRVASAS